MRTQAPSLVSVGYQGKSIDDLVERLLSQRVQILVDVRLMPLSRKPGFSKKKLAHALTAVGITYIHHRALGNPKDNRAGFRAGDPASIERYCKVLNGDAATAALDHVAELLDDGVVALLCFERDHTECHRTILARRLLEVRPNASVIHM
ncbi:DUF488 domain-containing protein [Mycobacterium avium]|uniref:DUF488 domain-containing protein n=1 Tax=Mycobacterium avium TaxID=1764 RepID=UPI001F32D929|nr:DUF488 domain-containing protein [Mycobacterium avium]